MPEITSILSYQEREQLANGFIRREVERANDSVKQPQRERLLVYFLAHHAADQPMTFFGLPGVRWEFEHLLDAQRDPMLTRYLAVERNYTLLQAGLAWIPGASTARPMEEELRIGNLQGWSTDRATILWTHAATFMGVRRAEKQRRNEALRHRARKRWSLRYKYWTAAWLDFSAPLGGEIITCLRHLPSHLDRTREEVPIALTFMIGRESQEVTAAMNAVVPEGEEPVRRRARFVEVLLNRRAVRRFVLDDAWSYTSAAGAPMGVVAGRLVLGDHVRRSVPRVSILEAARPIDVDFPEGSTVEIPGEPGVQGIVIGYQKKTHVRVLCRQGKLARQLVIAREAWRGG